MPANPFENILSNIVVTKPFIKDVENYIFKNDKKYVNSIKSKMNQIPMNFRRAQTLYRGMILEPSLVDAIKNQGYKDFELDSITSWSTEEKMAERFVRDASKKVGSGNNGVAVIFKKNVPVNKIILNLYEYCLYIHFSGIADEAGFDESTMEMGLEEKEVLVDSGVKLTKSDIKRVF